MKAIYYLKLMRFHFHISFITVIIGAVAFSSANLISILPKLVLCYAIFNVLIYGGLYTFNDIIDVKADSVHYVKKTRPIPSGNISILSAGIFCALLIASGLVIGYFYVSKDIYKILFGFIALNFAYTLMLKHVIYLNLATVASTHTLRLVLGITLAEATVGSGVVIAFYFLLLGIAFTIHSMFNLKPKEIPYYPKRRVLIIQIVCFLVATFIQIYASPEFSLPIIALTIFYLILLLCSHINILRPFIARVFMIKGQTT